MFRVSSHQVYMSTEKRVMDQSVRLNRLNNQISSGKRVEAGSDDPVAKRRIMHENMTIQEKEVYEKNVNEARVHLEESENAMGSIHDILDHVKNLALMMSNDTVNEEDRAQARSQVIQAMEDIISYGNSEVDGFYIFGGYRTAQAPFLPDGTYQGDDFARSLEVSPSVRKQTGIPGSHFLTGTVGNGINVFDTLTGLAEDLLTDDGELIQDRISELDQCLEQVSRYQSETGILIKEIEMSDVVNQGNVLEAQIRRGEYEDLDIASTISEFSTVKTALETTMATSSQVLKLTLLDYMR